MQITLPPEQERWLRAQVDIGVFASIEAAIVQIITAEMVAEIDDIASTRKALDEARLSVARGEGLSLDQAIQNMRGHMPKQRSS